MAAAESALAADASLRQAGRLEVLVRTPLRVMAVILSAASTAHAQIPLRPTPAQPVAQAHADSTQALMSPSTMTVALHVIVPKEIACPASFDDAVLVAGVRIFEEDLVSSPPHLLTLGRREYPGTLERGGIGGRVVLRYVVDTLGHPDPCSFEALEATNAEFEAAAYRMALATTFSPGARDGKPVLVRVKQSFTFAP